MIDLRYDEYDGFFVVEDNPEFEDYRAEVQRRNKAMKEADAQLRGAREGDIIIARIDSKEYRFEVCIGYERGFSIAHEQYEAIESTYLKPLAKPLEMPPHAIFRPISDGEAERLIVSGLAERPSQ
jgi:hypothetical protein